MANGDPPDIPLQLARWVLEDLPPEEVPELAVHALQDGCEAQVVALLAGLAQPSRLDIEDLVPGLLKKTGWTLPTTNEAVKTVVDDVARRLAVGELEPYAGAREISLLSHHLDHGGPVWQQCAPFIGMASEWEDSPEHRAAYETDIVDEARRLVDGGGLDFAV